MIAVCAPFSAVAYCVFGSVGGFRVTQLDRVRPRVQLSNEWYREDSDVAVPVKLNELKRIAIISGSFRPGWSYQENIWAERLAKQGIEVTVVCPRSRVTDSKGLPFTVKGVSTWGFESRQLLHERDVGPVVADLEPQCILWFGPPQRFGLSLIKERSLEQTPCAIFMGQNRRMQAFDWNQPSLAIRPRLKAHAYRWLRGPAIRRAVDRADLVVANTRETPEIIDLYLGEMSYQHKVMLTPLGFDPDAFSYCLETRARARTSLGLSSNDLTFLLSSRFSAEKEPSINLIWSAFERTAAELEHVHMIVTGLGDGEFSGAFRTRVQESRFAGRVHLHSFQARAELSDTFHAADVCVFNRPSISCQEALGTGCFGLFSNDGSLDWLIESPETGVTYHTDDVTALAQSMIEHVHRGQDIMSESARARRAALASRFNYDAVIDAVLSRLLCQSQKQY